MKAILTDLSAFEFWRSPLAISAKPTRVGIGHLCATSYSEVAKSAGLILGSFRRPLHLLVHGKSKRRRTCNTVGHVFPANISPTLYMLTEDVYVVAPEISFIQMARRLSLVHLIQYGMELCASYSVDPESEILLKHKPFCTSENLLAAIEKYSIAGSKPARRALPWVANNSASPRETQAYLMLCLPNRLGGYGLPKASLNYRVDLPKDTSMLLGKQYLLCDMYWPEHRLDVEYDSKAFHSGEFKIEEDSLRRNALGYLGVQSITLTRRHIASKTLFDGFAHQVARALSMRLRLSDSFPMKHAELRDELFIHTLDDHF